MLHNIAKKNMAKNKANHEQESITQLYNLAQCMEHHCMSIENEMVRDRIYALIHNIEVTIDNYTEIPPHGYYGDTTTKEQLHEQRTGKKQQPTITYQQQQLF
jgi:hypothetical protein